jgi:hypothetical protein
MIVPEEFKRFAEGFYQGSDAECSTPQEWIASALKRLDARQRANLKRFLTELLNKNRDEAELQDIWNSSSADYYIKGNDGIRTFLTMVRDMIEEPR